MLLGETGTGKTYTAFQIAHRLWKAGAKKRILFLADRNALIDQAQRGDFKHFRDKMTMVKNRKVDKSYEVYLALYQGITGSEDDRVRKECLRQRYTGCGQGIGPVQYQYVAIANVFPFRSRQVLCLGGLLHAEWLLQRDVHACLEL